VKLTHWFRDATSRCTAAWLLICSGTAAADDVQPAPAGRFDLQLDPQLHPWRGVLQSQEGRYGMGQWLIARAPADLEGQVLTYTDVSQTFSLNKLAHGLDAGPLRDIRLGARLTGTDDWRSVRYGVGFDLNLPGNGGLKLDLYVRRNAKRAGKRWQFNPLLLSSDRSWTLGGYLDRARGADEIAFVPRLVLDLDRLIGLPGQADASIQYGYWHLDQGDRPDTVPELAEPRAVQATVNWRF
jgi:hypothetical protein